jgi:hypothetical protein
MRPPPKVPMKTRDGITFVEKDDALFKLRVLDFIHKLSLLKAKLVYPIWVATGQVADVGIRPI